MSRVFERGYSLLFSRSYTAVGVVATAMTLALALLVFRKYLPIYVATLGVLTLLALASGVRVFTARRSLILASLTLLLTFLTDLVILLATGKERPLVGLGASAGLFSAPLIFLRRNSNSVRVIGVLLGIPIYLLLLAHFMGFYWLSNVGLAAFCLSMAALAYPYSIFSNGLGLFAGFTTSLLVRDPEPLEEELSKIGEERDLAIDVVRLKAGARTGVIIIPSVHSGPFDNVGGGNFVTRVFRKLKGLGVVPIYLHGVGSHELDPVSSSEADKVVERIAEVLREMPAEWNGIAHSPAEVSGPRVKVVSFGLGGAKIFTVTRLLKSSDDIPTWVAESVTRGRERLVLVDSQNRWCEDNKWEAEEVEELRELLDRAEKSMVECTDVELGFSHDARPGVFSPREVGAGGLSVLVAKICGRRLALVVFDGNNIKPKLYEKLVSKVRGMGYDVVEVLTTDTHQLTGFGRGRGYAVIGEHTPHDRIEDAVESAVRRAESTLTRAAFNYRRAYVRARVVGERGFRMVKELSKRGLESASKVIAVILAMPTIAVVLLSLIV